MIDKFQKRIGLVILGCFVIFTTLVFFQMWHNLFKNYFRDAGGNNALLLFGALFLTLLVGVILYYIRDDNHIINIAVLALLSLTFAVLAIVWIKSVPATQISDFGNFWSRTPDGLSGKSLYYYDNDYFAKWAYQTGFLVYTMTVVKIFGYHVAAVQYLNVIYQVLILIVSYQLVIKIFKNVKMARITVLLLMINLDWFALNSQADSQYLGSLLFLVTFLLILQDKYWAYVLSGLTLAIGAIVRPIGPVILAGIFVFGVVFMLFKNNKFHWVGIWKILIIFGIYFLIFTSAGALIKSSGLNQYGLTNRDSEWKFVTSLNYQYSGVYDQKLINKFNMDDSRSVMAKKEDKIVNEELNYLNRDKGHWAHLFYQKVSILWAQRSTGIDFTGVGTNKTKQEVKSIQYLGYLGSIITIIFSWIGSLYLFKNRSKKGLYLLLLPLMAFVIVQLFIEVQGRYRIEFIPILAIVGSVGMVGIFDWLKTLLEGRRHNGVQIRNRSALL